MNNYEQQMLEKNMADVELQQLAKGFQEQNKYYYLFKPEADKKVKALAQKVEDLTKQIPNIQKKLADETNNSMRLSGRIEKLKALASESLTEDKNSYEKFKTNLKNLNRELDTSQEVIRTFTDEILPKAKSDLKDASMNLRSSLSVFVRESRSVADAHINELLIACINERQEFLDCLEKIYSDYGLDFVINDESLCPGIWSGSEIRDLKLRLGLTPETPPEGSLIPSEAKSPTVEAESPCNEAVERPFNNQYE